VTKRDRLYLTHIVECADRIESYTAEGKEAFLTDTKTQDAVLRNLEVIAEASKRLSDEAKAVHPDIEWRGLVAMRNFVLHDVNPERVWQVVERDVRQLKNLRPSGE